MSTKTLIIAEKPSVARDIAGALGTFRRTEEWLESDTMVISSAVGHLVEIYTPESEVRGAPLPIIPAGGFELRATERGKQQFTLLKKLMARADVSTIVNACDAGREGEAIFRLIYDLTGSRKPVQRMWLQSMTRDSIIKAHRDMRPSADYEGLAAAARCRNEADWLFGINGSRAVGNSKQQSMSVGRVQTPTLAMIVDRHLTIANFIPRDYFEVHGRFQAPKGTYIGKWQNPAPAPEEPAERCADLATARAIQVKCDGVNPSSVTEESKPTTSSPPRLFDLTTLQREANKRFGFTATDTLAIAQSLYERHKCLTYPRTDSNCLPEDYPSKASETIKALASVGCGEYRSYAEKITTNAWVKPSKKVFDNSKISDHFAIIPTGSVPSGLSPQEKQIFDMVCRRFLAVFYPDAQFTSTTRITTVSQEKFKSTGRILISEGWLELYGTTLDDDDAEKTPALVPYSPGDKVTTAEVTVKANKTKPPAPYTEATLLGAMESCGKTIEDEALREAMKEKGIGTPATRASIIEHLCVAKNAKGPIEPYVRREKKSLLPTGKALELISFLRTHNLEVLTSPAMTGEWEHRLKLMESNQVSRPAFMREIEDQVRAMIQKIGTQPTGEKMTCACPKCAGPLLATAREVQCEAKCGFTLWREISHRLMSIPELQTLLSTREAGPFSGFLSKTGNKYTASLKLTDEYKSELVFTPFVPGSAPVGDALDYKCPKCKGTTLSATSKAISCKCGFSLWLEVAHKPLTATQAKTLITKGRVGPVAGLKSAKGNPFSATLVLDPGLNGKVNFEFQKK